MKKHADSYFPKLKNAIKNFQNLHLNSLFLLGL